MKPERQQQLDEAWLESLLESAYCKEESSEQRRMAAVIGKLDLAVAEDSSEVHRPATRSPWFSLRHLTALAIAASLLLLAVFVVDTTDSRAYAAVARSAQATPAVRMYKAHILFQRSARGQRQLTANIYVDPRNRYVVEHPAIMGAGTTWMGSDEHQRWLVPPRGPAYVGREQLVEEWLSQRDDSSPLLYLNTLLDRMAKTYKLSLLPNETIVAPSGTSTMCEHVRGELNVKRAWLPLSIDLWADLESGVAHKLILKWPASRERRGPLEWTIELVETNPQLADDWFELKGHSAGRRVVNVRSKREFDSSMTQ